MLHVVHDDHGNVVARIDAAALLFVRTRPLRAEALDAIERLARSIEDFRRGAVGALVVIHGEAGLSDNTLLERQRAFLRAFVRADGNVYFAMVVLGDSVQSIAMRAVVRLFMIGRKTMHMSSSVDEAAKWLGPHVGRDPADLVGAVNTLFDRARAAPD